MSKKCNFKTIYYEKPGFSVLKGDLLDYPRYEQLINKIILESENNNTFRSFRITTKSKFILKLGDNLEVAGLTSVWNKDTYDFFFEHIKKENIKKIKFIIQKIKEYPYWNPPKYHELLKNSLKLSWNYNKKEIQNDLTEKYLDDGKRLFIKKKIENEPSLKEELFKGFHTDIICNNCLTINFGGARYICSECDDFNICEYCKRNVKICHRQEHTFIKFNNPVFVKIQKYNSIFFPNKKLIRKKDKDPFEIRVEIINNGENSLQACFINAIRFGKNYLGCLKTTITDEGKKGEKIKVEFFIKFEEEEEEEEENLSNVYEGYYRLFTKEGIPFGDIFYIKLLIEE